MNERERQVKLWSERRASEEAAMPMRGDLDRAGARKSVSDDGKCLVCRGDLIPIDGEGCCRFCGTWQPVAKGVF